jgi:hypothetical protein
MDDDTDDEDEMAWLWLPEEPALVLLDTGAAENPQLQASAGLALLLYLAGGYGLELDDSPGSERCRQESHRREKRRIEGI